MKLSVIIVSYNVRYYLQQCLDSVVRATRGMVSARTLSPSAFHC